MILEQEINKKYLPVLTTKCRYVILMGGRGAGRSTFASQYATGKLVATLQYFRCAIMRLILGDIRNSIYQEILDRIDESKIRDAVHINDSMMNIDYGTNSINAVGFKKSSGDQKAKLKSLASYNCILVEEAEEISEADFMQLDDSLRTVKGDITIILLLNPPPKSHWIIKRWFNLLPSGVNGFYIPELKAEMTDTLFIRSNYRDNITNLSPQSIENYQRYLQTKPAHFFNMIEGLVPETVIGKIYSGWQQIPVVPDNARLRRHCLDFGYTNDPSAIVDLYEWNGGYVVDEQLYATGMLNDDLVDVLNTLREALTVADSSEPKSIDEIKAKNVNIIGAVKGPGSITQGIQLVQQKQIWVTSRSLNIWNEYENYAWLQDRDGNGLNEPKDAYNHAMDAIRYGITSLNSDVPQEIVNKQAARMNQNEQRIPKMNSTR